jgi:hypothetical protein
MALEWFFGRNPYVDNYFARVQMGPTASPRQILHQSRQLLMKLKSGRAITVGDRALNEHEVNDAANKLREPEHRAEETVCVHRPLHSGKSRIKKLVQELADATQVPDEPAAVGFAHPLGVMWFCPAPKPGYVATPDIKEFALVEVGDPEDIAIDIVFDC